MYRNTASFAGNNMTAGGQPTAKPSSSDADLEISELLVRKRQQLDQEIQEFKAAKEKEFQSFERSLRKQRQRRKRDSNPARTSANDSRPGALGLLALPNKQGMQANGSASSSQTDPDATPRSSAPLGRPTTGLEKLSIRGETTPPSTLTVGSPPSSASPTNPLKSVARRPPTPGEPTGKNPHSFTPPEKQPLTPPIPTGEMRDAFAGVFTPVYLPLLDSRPSSEPPSAVSTPARQGSYSLPDSASLSITPMRRAYRAHTEPVIPSTSLPSALRTASGTAVRKRKHVTFQLADSAIVEPSSSYEELPSPSPKDDAWAEDRIDERLRSPAHAEDDEPEPTRRLALAVPSPTLRGRDRRSSAMPGDLTEAVGGASGVGFFELDEELSSPAMEAAQPFMEDFEEDSSPVESRRGDNLNEKGHESLLTYEYGGSVPINIVRPSSSWVGSFGH